MKRGNLTFFFSGGGGGGDGDAEIDGTCRGAARAEEEGDLGDRVANA